MRTCLIHLARLLMGMPSRWATALQLRPSLRQSSSASWLCRQLAVASSGFYAWRQRQQNPGPRAQQNAAITTEVHAVFDRHRGFYGAPRVHQELRAAGLKVGRHRAKGRLCDHG